MKTGRLVLSLALILVGIYTASTMVSLARAYMAKPDAPNGGISIASYFVHMTYPEAIAGLAVGVIVLFAGIGLGISATRVRKPVATLVK